MPDTFDVRNWLNNYFPNAEFNRDEVNTVTDFSLMWNLFEFEMGNRQMSIQQITACALQIVNKAPGNDFYNDYYQYFRDRYINVDNTTNDLFDGLAFRPNDKKDFVANVLKDDNPGPGSIIEAILIIIYRFRNNLFHGEKRLHNIHTQYENFNMANEFLANILTINKT